MIFESTDWRFERLSPFPCLFSESARQVRLGYDCCAQGAALTGGLGERVISVPLLPLQPIAEGDGSANIGRFENCERSRPGYSPLDELGLYPRTSAHPLPCPRSCATLSPRR
jgi:hypothetical protein